ncbi:MAG: hypothetical protein IIB71_09330 [Proteobacteria bacterium]|nr:hypothetical protein [Pseudomonadota bacterium]
MINRRGFVLGFLLFSMHVGALAELPQYSEELHLGVATCASSVCHGSVRPRTSNGILQNEYVVWSRLDRHRNAYNTLLSAESKKIARNMGLQNAHEAEICLDCHADNVAEEKRGPRFQIEDGVGCEACHGGAENYLANHTDKGISRQQNLSSGLYATDQIADRAALCFSCHIGSEDKIASHEIMGAGHPRLAFELDTFGVLQPAHYVVDKAYRERKWAGSSFTTWALGQVEAGKQMLGLVESKLTSKQIFPELSLFDCHACHHVMSKKRWKQQERIRLAPGSVRLNDVNFLMLFPLARVFTPALYNQLRDNLRELHKQVDSGGDFSGVVKRLVKILGSMAATISINDSNREVPRLVEELVSMGRSGQFQDYIAAEQAVMAIDLLLSILENGDDRTEWLDSLYESVQEEDQYDPLQLIRVMERYDGDKES